MNGFDLAQRIRKPSWNKSAPIVIVTGRDDRRNHARGICHWSNILSPEARGQTKTDRFVPDCPGRASRESASAHASSPPDSGDLHWRLSNDAGSYLEPELGWNAGRNR